MQTILIYFTRFSDDVSHSKVEWPFTIDALDDQTANSSASFPYPVRR